MSSAVTASEDHQDEAKKGEYVGSERRGFDPALRAYRVAVYLSFGVFLLWFCGGLLFSVIGDLF